MAAAGEGYGPGRGAEDKLGRASPGPWQGIKLGLGQCGN